MFISSLLLALGLFLLIKGGNWLVNGSSAVARKYGISELVIGLTVVAFGTSAPEMVVSVLAAADNHPEIALGNAIGSNNFNLFIILGISGLIAPLEVKTETIRKEIPLSLIAAVLLIVLANDSILGKNENLVSRADGLILLLLFSAFLYFVWRGALKSKVNDEFSPESVKPWKSGLLITAGLAGLIIGGKLVVSSAIDLARFFNVSEKLIGLTIVAAGTSLPELVTSIIAVRKDSSDMAIGNVIGSNIFNIFFILGVGSVVNPLSYSHNFNPDMILLVFGTILLFFAMFTGSRKKLDRWESLLFILMYIAYMVFVGIRS